MGGGNKGCTEPAKSGNDIPILIAALYDNKHSVALSDAERFKGICRLFGKAGDIGKGEGFCFALVVCPDECAL